jgi:hypothetical protein
VEARFFFGVILVNACHDLPIDENQSSALSSFMEVLYTRSYLRQPGAMAFPLHESLDRPGLRNLHNACSFPCVSRSYQLLEELDSELPQLHDYCSGSINLESFVLLSSYLNLFYVMHHVPLALYPVCDVNVSRQDAFQLRPELLAPSQICVCGCYVYVTRRPDLAKPNNALPEYHRYAE